MGWHQFKYVFNRQVENAMRYSVEEAVRRHPDGTVEEVALDAVETFKRKLDKHAGAKSPAYT